MIVYVTIFISMLAKQLIYVFYRRPWKLGDDNKNNRVFQKSSVQQAKKICHVYIYLFLIYNYNI